MKVNNRLLAILLLVVSANLSFAQELNKGWEHFKNNRLVEARKAFLAARNNPSERAEANLMLVLIPAVDKSMKDPFEYIKDFYELSENPDPYLSAIWHEPGVDLSGKLDKDRIKFIKGIISNPKTNSTMRANARSTLIRHFEAIGNFEKANAVGQEMGTVDVWQNTGVFDNISAGGFDKDHDPIHKPQPNSIFKDKSGANVTWVDLKKNLPGRWINHANTFPFSNSIIFSQTFCKSPEDRNVQFRIGTSGSLKMWVNDKLIFSEKIERNNGIDTYTITGKLKQGNNRILIQIGESEVSNSNFMLRITDLNGESYSDLKYSNVYAPYAKAGDEKNELVPLFAEAFLEAQIKVYPDKLLNYILLADTYLSNDKVFQARKIIQEAQKLAPDCMYLYWQLAQLHMRDKNRTGLSITLEKMKSNAPDYPLSIKMLYSEAIEKENYEEARKLLNKLEGYYGETAYVLGEKIELASHEKDFELLYKLIDKAYARHNDKWKYVYLKYLLEKDARKKSASANNVLKAYTKSNYNKEALSLMAQYQFELGALSTGLNYFLKMIENEPYNTSLLTKVGEIYFATQNYKKAREFFERALDITPYVGSYMSNVAKVNKELGKKDVAIEYYQKSLDFSYNNYDTRRELRKLKGQPEIFSYFEEPNLDSIYKASPDGSGFTEDNSLILLDESQKVIYPEGGSEEKHYFMVKIFNTDGIDRWNEYRIPQRSNQRLNVEKAEIIKKDGNRLKAEVNRNHVVFSNLEEGDAIIIVHKIENYQFGKLAKHFWGKHYFTLFFPYQLSKYSLLVPEDMDFQHAVSNSAITPTISTTDGFKKYTWQKENVPSVKHESYMSLLVDIGEILHFSSIPDWNFVSDWYNDISKTKTESEYEVKEVIQTLFEPNELETLTQKEKAKRIYDYIVQNIRYSSVSFRQSGIVPQKASDVINTKIGDCKDVSTLFVSLCKELGIDAKLVLVNTRDNGENDMFFPSIEFNHCIAKLNLEEETYYLELTSDYNPFSSFGRNLKNAFALDIDPKIEQISPQLLNPVSRVNNNIIRESKVFFTGNNMKVEKLTYKTGDLAASMRHIYRDKGTKEREKNMLEAISDDYQNVKLNLLQFEKDLESTSDTVTYQYHYTVANPFSRISNMELIKLPWADNQKPIEFLSAETRNYPIELWKYKFGDVRKETLSVEIPSGKTLIEVPKTVKYDASFADYSLSFKLHGNKIVVTRTFTIKNDRILPHEFDQAKQFFENVVNADAIQIGFK